jgi:hypothetical protein
MASSLPSGVTVAAGGRTSDEAAVCPRRALPASSQPASWPLPLRRPLPERFPAQSTAATSLRSSTAASVTREPCMRLRFVHSRGVGVAPGESSVSRQGAALGYRPSRAASSACSEIWKRLVVDNLSYTNTQICPMRIPCRVRADGAAIATSEPCRKRVLRYARRVTPPRAPRSPGGGSSSAVPREKPRRWRGFQECGDCLDGSRLSRARGPRSPPWSRPGCRSGPPCWCLRPHSASS